MDKRLGFRKSLSCPEVAFGTSEWGHGGRVGIARDPSSTGSAHSSWSRKVRCGSVCPVRWGSPQLDGRWETESEGVSRAHSRFRWKKVFFPGWPARPTPAPLRFPMGRGRSTGPSRPGAASPVGRGLRRAPQGTPARWSSWPQPLKFLLSACTLIFGGQRILELEEIVFHYRLERKEVVLHCNGNTSKSYFPASCLNITLFLLFLLLWGLKTNDCGAGWSSTVLILYAYVLLNNLMLVNIRKNTVRLLYGSFQELLHFISCSSFCRLESRTVSHLGHTGLDA